MTILTACRLIQVTQSAGRWTINNQIILRCFEKLLKKKQKSSKISWAGLTHLGRWGNNAAQWTCSTYRWMNASIQSIDDEIAARCIAQPAFACSLLYSSCLPDCMCVPDTLGYCRPSCYLLLSEISPFILQRHTVLRISQWELKMCCSPLLFHFFLPVASFPVVFIQLNSFKTGVCENAVTFPAGPGGALPPNVFCAFWGQRYSVL